MKGVFQPLRSLTLWIPNTGPANDPSRGHVFVILTNTCADGKNLLVPVCTRRTKFDSTCLLGKGDHEFIKEPSFVFYAGLQTREAAVLKKQADDDIITYKGILDKKLFALVCAGVEQSRFSPPKFVHYFNAQTAKS